jgi:hypothetical protein
MEGVTTALVGFIFVCVVYPQLVKNRPQYYAALAFGCVIILLDGLATMLSSSGFRVFAYAIEALLQVCAILLLFLAAGGITWRELAGDMGNAFEVIRRGGDTKEVIIPLTGQQPKPRVPRTNAPSERIVLAPGLPPQSPSSDAKIPLE